MSRYVWREHKAAARPLAVTSLRLDTSAAGCPAVAFFTNSADSCKTYGLAKGLARTAADAADSPCIAI